MARPADFPASLPDNWYDFDPDPDTDPVAVAAHVPLPGRIDPRDSRWTSLYDLNLLAGRPSTYAARDRRALRKRWRQKFQRADNGAWKHVEFVPPWTDPDWDNNFVHTEGAQVGNRDTVTAQYVKRGTFQTHRPALLPEDAIFKPTQSAKRWGLYPFRQAGQQDDFPTGMSGVTPLDPDFPSVRYVSATGQIQVADLQSERRDWEVKMAQAGLPATDQAFADDLRAIVRKQPDGTPQQGASLAEALLHVHTLISTRDEREDYQRILFAGNTTEELMAKGAWNEGNSADVDLAEPLHDILKIDKWRSTSHRGAKANEPRIVYNIDGKQGEFTAHNPVIWNVIQPALQLVSKFLNCNHPMFLAWADMRKLRPIRDRRDTMADPRNMKQDPQATAAGVFRANMFSIWPEFSGLESDLDSVSRQWDDMIEICRAGFDTSRYAFEILQATVRWEFSSEWRAGNTNSETGDILTAGATHIERNFSGTGPPFHIKIEVSADLIWPLLVDEYSTAEKGAVSFHLANTMLHELSHALNFARMQMSQPSPPLWLTLNPAWPVELQNFDNQHGTAVLKSLQKFGLRMLIGPGNYTHLGLIHPKEEFFVEDEPDAEEGYATEHKFFGGIFGAITMAGEKSSRLESPRFLSNNYMMLHLRGWSTSLAASSKINGALPAEKYLRFFHSQFWNVEHRCFGHEALKLGADVISTVHDPRSFSMQHSARDRYGPAAAAWLVAVVSRVVLDGDDECRVLWQYLLNRLFTACEPQVINQQWYQRRERWYEADYRHWSTRLRVIEAAESAVYQMDVLKPPKSVDPLTWYGPPVKEVRVWLETLSRAVFELNAEVVDCQNMMAQYLRLEDCPEKELIFDKYSADINKRLNEVYVCICATYTSFLDRLDDGMITTPNQAIWINRNPDMVQLLTVERPRLRAKIINIQHHFITAANVFNADPASRVTAISQLRTIPSSGSRTAAGRLQRLANIEYQRLADGDPRKKIAEDWNEIIDKGDSLRDPAQGSPAAAINAQLAARTQAAVDMQNQGLSAQSPASPQGVHHGSGTGLQSNQPPDNRPRRRRLNQDSERIFTHISGYRPYADPVTGLTHFEKTSTAQPQSAQQFPAPTAPAPPPPAIPTPTPNTNPAALLQTLEASVDWYATQLRAFTHHGAGALRSSSSSSSSGSNVPSSSSSSPGADHHVFGQAVAPVAQALQSVEALLAQREATIAFMQDPAADFDRFRAAFVAQSAPAAAAAASDAGVLRTR
ncbi:unnamed protein product [Discula destructiva]